MENFTIEQMTENTKLSLVYPFHMNMKLILDKSKGYNEYNEAPNFETALMAAYLEPNAFYLTEEDEDKYSHQEFLLLEATRRDQIDKLARGYELVTLDLTPETLEYLEEYKRRTGLTTEEAVISILKKIIEDNKKEDGNQ